MTQDASPQSEPPAEVTGFEQDLDGLGLGLGKATKRHLRPMQMKK